MQNERKDNDTRHGERRVNWVVMVFTKQSDDNDYKEMDTDVL